MSSKNTPIPTNLIKSALNVLENRDPFDNLSYIIKYHLTALSSESAINIPIMITTKGIRLHYRISKGGIYRTAVTNLYITPMWTFMDDETEEGGKMTVIPIKCSTPLSAFTTLLANAPLIYYHYKRIFDFIDNVRKKIRKRELNKYKNFNMKLLF